MTVEPIKTDRDQIKADIEVIRRMAPTLAEGMMIFYDALRKQGFDHETACEFVAHKFLVD